MYRICFDGKWFGNYEGENESVALQNCISTPRFKQWSAEMLEMGISEVGISVLEIKENVRK